MDTLCKMWKRGWAWGGGMGEKDASEDFSNSQELVGVDPNATLSLTSILALPQTMSIL